MGIRISQLPEAFTLSTEEDVFPILQNDITKKARLSLVKIPEYTSVFNYVNSTSSIYEEHFTNLKTTSSNWDYSYNVISLSADLWNNTYDELSAKSLYWDSLYDQVSSNFIPLTGDNLNVYLTNSNLNLTGNFEIGHGEETSFYIGENGKVGIYTETPNETLTVAGSFSAQDIVYAKDGNSNIWNDTSQKISQLPEGITASKAFVDKYNTTHIISIVKGIITAWDEFASNDITTWNDTDLWDDQLIWNESL